MLVAPPTNSARTSGPSPKAKATAASPPLASSSPPGQAGADVRQHGQAAADAGGVGGAEARAHRADHVDGRHRRRQGQGGVDGVGVRLVEVGRLGGGEPETRRLVAVGRGPQGDARRLDAERGRVLVERGHAARAPAPAAAQGAADGRTLEAPVGHVGPVRDDSGHPAKPTPRVSPSVEAVRCGRHNSRTAKPAVATDPPPTVVRQTRSMITKKRHRDGHTKVVFSLPDAGEPVSVVADFNGWDPTAHPLRKRSNGMRSVAVMLPPGTWTRFRYVSGGPLLRRPRRRRLRAQRLRQTHTLLAV